MDVVRRLRTRTGFLQRSVSRISITDLVITRDSPLTGHEFALLFCVVCCSLVPPHLESVTTPSAPLAPLRAGSQSLAFDINTARSFLEDRWVETILEHGGRVSGSDITKVMTKFPFLGRVSRRIPLPKTFVCARDKLSIALFDVKWLDPGPGCTSCARHS